MRYAAEHYRVECVGLTISRAQAAWGQERTGGLPVRFELIDYRWFNQDGSQRFDRIASVGMFEHVGPKNYRTYFQMARCCLKEEGLFLLRTIGKNQRGLGVAPWIDKYIFPNGVLPSLSELMQSCEPEFVVEELHNFGADYDRTLMVWLERFDVAWPSLQAHYPERFCQM